MRMVFAASLALGIHAALFWIDLPWSQPALFVPRSRAVSIDLVTFDTPIEKPAPAKPRVIRPKPKPIKPKPAPRPVPKPVVKKVIHPKPDPPPVPTPMEPLPEEFDMAALLPPDEDPPVAAPAAEPETADTADDRAPMPGR